MSDDGRFPVSEKYKAMAPADQVKHASENFNSSSSTGGTLTYIPSWVLLEATEDAWVRFDGQAAAKSAPSLRLVKNVPYGPIWLGRGGQEFQVIGDTASGTLSLVYGMSNHENGMDANPNE